MRTTVILVMYGILVTVFAGASHFEADRVEQTYEDIIFQQEKLLLEMEQGTLVSCSTEIDGRGTYDDWISDEPCPAGRHGPLCHMNPPEAQ